MFKWIARKILAEEMRELEAVYEAQVKTLVFDVLDGASVVVLPRAASKIAGKKCFVYHFDYADVTEFREVFFRDFDYDEVIKQHKAKKNESAKK